MHRIIHLVLYTLVGTGIVLRCFSVSWNVIPHGDITLDAAAAQAMYSRGNFQLSSDTTLPPADQYLIQHPPIWPLLGAGMMYTSHQDAFTSLKLLSLLCGIFLLPMMYRISAHVLRNRSLALLLTSILSMSWLMIDFSGNGALYSLHALCLLLWTDVAIRPQKYYSEKLALVSGISYLINYQTIILFPASIIVLLIRREQVWKSLMLYGIIALLTISPWLVRNYLLFGEPFFGHTINSTYLYQKVGLNSNTYIHSTAEKLIVMKQMLTRWLPFNLYFAARKLFILAPVLFIAFAYSLADVPLNRKRFLFPFPLLLICLAHLGISTAWPVMKFRYFVPLLPLVLLIASEYALHLRVSVATKHAIFGSALLCTVILSYITAIQIPTHTYYYDGAITQDAFHGEGEIHFMQEHGIL